MSVEFVALARSALGSLFEGAGTPKAWLRGCPAVL